MKTKSMIISLALCFILLFSSSAMALTVSGTSVEATNPSITYGDSDSIYVYLWHTSTAYSLATGLDNETVALQSRTIGITDWTTLTSGLTTSYESGGTTYPGILAYTSTPTATTEYRSVFDGDETYDPSESEIVTQTVKAKVTMKGVVNNTSHIFKLTGSVGPKHKSKKVTLKMKKKGGAWKTIAKPQLNASSNYKHNVKFKNFKKGTYYFVSSFSDTDHAKGQSTQWYLKVS